MENTSASVVVHILPFFISNDDTRLFVFSLVYFFLIYLIGILLNISIIAVICLSPDLHTPMYLFLGNLSLVDIFYTTVTVPKLLHILLSGNNQMPFTQCLMQMYFFFIADSAEVTILLMMAYDRYVAICHPLHYHRILNQIICILLIILIWASGCVNASLLTSSVLKLSFCSSVAIHQFFCDAKALINIACRGTEMFHIIVYADCFIFGFCPVVGNLLSYIKIITVIQHMKSKDGRSKALSTCSSHLTVMAIFYGSAVSVYMTPSSHRYDLLEQILTMFYNTMVPMLNPLIYSLRNKEVKCSLRKIMF